MINTTASNFGIDIPAIALSIKSEIQFLLPTEINYLNAEGSYTHIYLKSGKKVTVCKKLGEIQKTLPGEYFARVHQSFIVNVANILSFSEGKESKLLMKTGESITVSRRRKSEFLSRFTKL